MRRKVVYIAHPLGTGPDREANRARAARWVAWAAFSQGVSPVADWITLSGQVGEERRQEGLECDLALVERCDAVWLVGGCVSPGMRAEAEHAAACGVEVVDMTGMVEEPPALEGIKR